MEPPAGVTLSKERIKHMIRSRLNKIMRQQKITKSKSKSETDTEWVGIYSYMYENYLNAIYGLVKGATDPMNQISRKEMDIMIYNFIFLLVVNDPNGIPEVSRRFELQWNIWKDEHKQLVAGARYVQERRREEIKDRIEELLFSAKN